MTKIILSARDTGATRYFNWNLLSAVRMHSQIRCGLKINLCALGFKVMPQSPSSTDSTSSSLATPMLKLKKSVAVKAKSIIRANSSPRQTRFPVDIIIFFFKKSQFFGRRQLLSDHTHRHHCTEKLSTHKKDHCTDIYINEKARTCLEWNEAVWF
jgi:hypothetical protein